MPTSGTEMFEMIIGAAMRQTALLLGKDLMGVDRRIETDFAESVPDDQKAFTPVSSLPTMS